MPSGVDPRTLLDPQAFTALDRLERAVWRTPRPDLVELARRRVAMLLGDPAEQARRPVGAPDLDLAVVDALADWPSSPRFSETDRAVLSFTEQFVMDVAGTTDSDRARLGSHLTPEEMGGFVLSLYVVDYGLRARMALTRLFPEAGPLAAAPVTDDDRGIDLGVEFDAMLKAIALLDALDPVTTELVRLRGARTHNCRICQSTRSVAAMRSGADEATFDQVDFYPTSDLDPAIKTALRLTDAIITQPSGIDPALVAEVRAHFSPAQTVEIVLDVVRNSAQKSAVAMAVDQAHVDEGVELYEIGADGDVIFHGPATQVA